MVRRTVLLLAALLVGCAQAPAGSPERSSRRVAAAGDETAGACGKQDRRVDTRLIDDWAELDPTLRGVYLAEVRSRTRPDGFNELCATPRELLHGAALPGRDVCTRMDAIVGQAASWPPLSTSGTALVATVTRRGAEAILGAVAADSCGGDCRTRFREALWPQIRCGEIARFWSEIPPEDARCTRDDECVALTAMCFEAGVRADRRAPYDEVLRVHGVCQHPAAGPCAPSRGVAACVAHACTAL